MIYLKLIYVFIKIGLLGFGGGYSMLSLIQFEVVDYFGWMSVTEFSDMLAISQMTPGPVSINTATYVGFATAGLPGAIVSTAALCFPSVVLMFLVIKFFFNHKENIYVQAVMNGLRPVLGGLILAAALLLMNQANFCDISFDFSNGRNITVLIFILSFVAVHFLKANPMWVIIVAGCAGALVL